MLDESRGSNSRTCAVSGARAVVPQTAAQRLGELHLRSQPEYDPVDDEHEGHAQRGIEEITDDDAPLNVPFVGQ